MILICNNKNDDNYDDKWIIAITIIAIKTKQYLNFLPSVKTWMEGTYDIPYKKKIVTTEPNMIGFLPRCR